MGIAFMRRSVSWMVKLSMTITNACRSRSAVWRYWYICPH